MDKVARRGFHNELRGFYLALTEVDRTLAVLDILDTCKASPHFRRSPSMSELLDLPDGDLMSLWDKTMNATTLPQSPEIRIVHDAGSPAGSSFMPSYPLHRDGQQIAAAPSIK